MKTRNENKLLKSLYQLYRNIPVRNGLMNVGFDNSETATRPCITD